MEQQNNYTKQGSVEKTRTVDISRKSNTKWKITKYFLLWAILVFAGIKIKETVLGWMKGNMVINPIFSFKEVHNHGAAFSLLQGKTDELIIAGIICIIILTGFVVFKPSKLSQQMVSAMALLAGGMTVNTIERIQQGYVTDYIYFTLFDKFPVFNIADMMIVIGAFMLACSLLFKTRRYQ